MQQPCICKCNPTLLSEKDGMLASAMMDQLGVCRGS